MVTFRGYLRIALRSRILGALLIAGAGLLVYLRVAEHLQGAGILLQVFRLPVLTPLVVLVQVFLSIRAAQMEEDLHVDELMASLPAAAAGSLTARVLAQYCAALLVYGLLFALGAFLFTALPGLPMTHAPLRTAALMGAVSLLPATALGFALGLLFRRGLPAHLTGLLVFVAGPVLAMYTGSGGRTPLTALDWPMLLSFPLASPTLFPDAGLVAYNRLFAVGLTMLCLGQAYGVSLRRRGERDWQLVGSLLGAGLLLAAAGVGASQAEWRGREAAYMAEVAYYTAPPHLTGVITPEVGKYDLDVSLQPASRSMQVEASVALVSADPYADFTLRHPLTVERVIGPDGSAVPFARSGDYVRVYTEGRPGTYTFHYRGTVWQWRRTDQGQLALGAHVAEGSVILPANHGWYPLPGAWLLSVPAREPGGQVVWMQDRPVEHDPVPMTVKVIFGSAEVPVATNARDGQPVTAGWVIAQGYWSRAASSPGVMLSDLSAGDRTGVEGVRSAVNGYVARWFPSRGPLQWLEVSEAFALHATLYPQFPGAVIRTAPGGAGVGSALSNRLLLDRMHDLWLPDGRTREERALLAGVRLYLEEVFGAETGLPLGNLNRREPAAAEPVDEAVRDRTCRQLLALRDESGGDAARQVVHALLEQYAAGPLTAEVLDREMGRVRP